MCHSAAAARERVPGRDRPEAVDACGDAGYARGVATRNFASAEYEPTDEDLAELMHEAFAGVRNANEQALAGLEDQVAAQRAVVLARLAVTSKAGRDR